MAAYEEKTKATSDQIEQLVVFTLGMEYYGVGIEAVNTIIRLPEITKVPHTPDYVLGVMNLRGMIVPVIDLRARFGLNATEWSKSTRIIVVENHGLQVGMVVDGVSQTMQLASSQIEPLSPLVSSVDAQYLRGVGKDDNRLIILLELTKVLAREEVHALQSVAKQSDMEASAA
jgi:purine-binding chemotaxis protein CheW